MCGIVVTHSEEEQDVSRKIIHRGPDQQDQVIAGPYRFMFNRLAIMDLHETGMQPFTYKKHALVANAEIYNYESIKRELGSEISYKGTSDCEVLLPFYDVHGVDMFKSLDAEFAIILYDGEKDKLIAARDPIGIRPLFYGYNKQNEIIFASEVKAIIDIVDHVFPFPPGHYYDGSFKMYCNMYDVKNTHNNLDEILLNIRYLFEQAVIKRLHADADMGFLLSGGLDSSLVVALSVKHSKQKVHTFSIGMDTDPIDLKYAKQVADYLGTIHHEVTMTKNEVIDSLDELIYTLETYDITTVRASIGMYILSKYIHSNSHIKTILTGEVSDELFGYKYTDFAPNAEAFQDESIKRLKELYFYDVLRADRSLAAFSLEARVPFADKAFMEYILQINPVLKMNQYNMGKYLLRKSFEDIDLPENILWRDKAAFSDAVGHSMVDHLKAHAESLFTDSEFNHKKTRYNPEPISKEALMYREIFERYYPNHGDLIPGYWMPNKDWENCDVNDPSARVLKNYGKSGQ
jgi:asparagine synthase (glutamine-hydrolysing)